MCQEHLGGCRHDGHTFLPDVWDYLHLRHNEAERPSCGVGVNALPGASGRPRFLSVPAGGSANGTTVGK
jgi:hypothetical protein